MNSRQLILALGLLAAVALSSGCIGTFNNKDMFITPPTVGTPEVEVLKKYGTPAYAGFSETKKIYTYKVRNSQYIILVGLYDGYDLVLVCENGVVREVTNVPRPKAFTLLNPVPWAVAD